MKTKTDHIVIGADNLSQGVEYVKEHLGVNIPFGGIHEKMGTHNHLVQLGNDAFLEVISVNPAGTAPNRPRWYGLEDPYVCQLIKKEPRLLTWVVNTENIKGVLDNASVSFGKPVHLNRGSLSWEFGLPDDGRILGGGMLPYIIEWHTAFHPSIKMADMGLRLEKLVIHHSCPSWLESILESIGADDLVTITPLEKSRVPFMTAYIKTPGGIKELRTTAGDPAPLV